MSHSCVENYLHIIFATKSRASLIPLEIESRLYFYLAGIAKQRKVPILKVNGTDDHLHMLLKLHPDVALSKLMKELKAYSTGWIKKEGFNQFGWQ
jgi:putative transposase